MWRAFSSNQPLTFFSARSRLKADALVPVALKSQLEKAVSEKLGRQVTVGAVDFRPWSLELTLRDLAIAKAASPVASAAGPESSLLSPGAPQIKIARLYIDAEMQSLLRLAPVADAIAVDGLALSARRSACSPAHSAAVPKSSACSA